MKRHLSWRQAIETKQYNRDEWSIHLSVDSGDVSILCCELSLLLFEKAKSLSLTTESGQKVVLRVATEHSRVVAPNARSFSIELNPQDLENTVSYLLSWYRDGIAEVSHIDIDLAAESDWGANCTVVVQADQSKPPLSQEETTRLLRDLD